MQRKDKIELFFVQSAIVVAVGIAVLMFLSTFFHLLPLEHIWANYQAINHYLQRLIALVVLIFSVNLAQRKRIAWLGIIVLLSVSLFSHFFLHQGYFSTFIIICEIYILGVLLAFHQYFNRRGKKLTLKQTVIISAAIILAILLNALYEVYILRSATGGEVSLVEGIPHTARMILGMETGDTAHAAFETFLVTFFWGGVIACLLFILRAATINRSISLNDKIKARNLVKTYGQNPGSYLTLEQDKMLFFGKVTEGVVAYGIVGDVIVVNGDPVCKPEEFSQFLAEFKLFCDAGFYQCILLSTTGMFLENYTALGYSHVKCGEEARFNLQELTLAGGKVAKLRANINHANKAGLTTLEYKPLPTRDREIESRIQAVSNEWIAEKKTSQLAFTVGGVGLEDPMERRYFYAENPDGKMVAFNVYLPFAGMDGYMADVTRRTKDAPAGATEKIIYDAFTKFKQEGVHWGSMGLAPLSNVHEDGVEDSATVKILQLIYNKFNSFYGFKDLRAAKERYSPSSWEPGYFVYSTKNITPQMAYAIVKIQNPQGILDYLKGLFKK